MADVRDGLTSGEGASLDVNSEAGFMAAIAKSVGAEVPAGQLEEIESRSTSVASGLTTEESVQARDDQGRFAPAAPAVSAPEGAAPVGDQGTLDPDLSNYLTRHGGDATAALAAAIREAKEAQSLIGRQGNDLGAERQARQELAERLARLEGRMEARPPERLPIASTEDVDAVQTYVAEHGGQAAMAYILRDDINRPDLIDAALQAWALDDPVSAAGWNARYQTHMAIIEAEASRQQFAPAQPAGQADAQVAGLSSSLDAVKASMPEAEWVMVREHLSPLLDDPATPEVIKTAVTSSSREAQIDGIKGLVAIARGRVIAQATADAVAANAEAARQAKLAAGVATGSLRPVAEPVAPGAPIDPSDRIAAFHRSLMDTETTSVRDGLTFGK